MLQATRKAFGGSGLWHSQIGLGHSGKNKSTLGWNIIKNELKLREDEVGARPFNA